MADLMRQLSLPCEVDFMAISSYGEGTDSSGSSGSSRTWTSLTAATSSRRGHHRLGADPLVPDAELRRAEPASLEVCALLVKHGRRDTDVPVKYVGFEIPNRFVVGYGLDFAERYRNLPHVAVLQEESKRAQQSSKNLTRRGTKKNDGCYPGARRLLLESLFPLRTLPADRDRAARLPGEPDAAREQQER